MLGFDFEPVDILGTPPNDRQPLAEIGRFFGNLLSFLGDLLPLDPNFDIADSAQQFISTILHPTHLLAPLVTDAAQGIGMVGFVPMENLAMDLIGQVVGGAQELIDAILGTAAGVGTVEDVEHYFDNLLALLGLPTLHMDSAQFDPVYWVENFITTMLHPTNLLAPLDQVSGLVPDIHIPIDYIESILGNAQHVIDAILDATAGTGTIGELEDYFENLLAMFGMPDFASNAATFDPIAAVETFITAMLHPTGMLAPLDQVSGLVPDIHIPIDYIESILGNAQHVIDAILGTAPGVGSITNVEHYFENLLSMFGGPLFNQDSANFDPILAVESFISTMVNPTGLLAPLVSGLVPEMHIPQLPIDQIIGLEQELLTFLTSGDPLNAGNLFGKINHDILGLVPIGILTDGLSNLLGAAGFPSSNSIAENPFWTWDPTQSSTSDGTGSARVEANGALNALRSNRIHVSEGKDLSQSIRVKWQNLVASPGAIHLDMVVNPGVGETIIVLDTAPNSTNSDWITLSGSHTVAAGETEVEMRLVVDDRALSGVVNWDTGHVTLGDLIRQSWVHDLVSDWNALYLAFGGTDVSGVTNAWSNLLQIFNVGDLTDLVGDVGSFDPVPHVENFVTSMLHPTGLLAPLDQVSGLVPDIHAPQVVQDTINFIHDAYTNLGAPSGSGNQPVDSVLTNMWGVFDTALAAHTGMAQLVTAHQALLDRVKVLEGGTPPPDSTVQVNDPFDGDYSTYLPGYTQGYTDILFNPVGTSTGTIGLDGDGYASWHPAGILARYGWAVNNTPLASTDGMAAMVLATAIPLTAPDPVENYLLFRSNATGTIYLRLRVTLTHIQLELYNNKVVIPIGLPVAMVPSAGDMFSVKFVGNQYTLLRNQRTAGPVITDVANIGAPAITNGYHIGLAMLAGDNVFAQKGPAKLTVLTGAG